MNQSSWETLLLEPDNLRTEQDLWPWFDTIAQRLLCGTRFLVGDVPHRFIEIEFYYHGEPHLDLFTHRDPIQKSTGKWYFHRTAGVYRGGSFKGFDLTFGGSSAFGGILIRGIEEENGPLIDGPSLSVDHLLKQTEAADVATLDEAIENRPAWDSDSPLRIEWMDTLANRPLLKTARVGLSLKKLRKAEPPTRFILRPYRYLSEPRRTSKGKQHMVLALHTQGLSPAVIREQTGGTKAAIDRYVADFAEGNNEDSFDSYFGIDLGPKELARLHGLWWKQFGQSNQREDLKP